MTEDIIVGISDYKITQKPNRLITYALGSCVGVAIYDVKQSIGGLSHILLYDSTLFNQIDNINQFADTAIPHMINEMIFHGAKQHHLVAKIAGGANVLGKPVHSPVYDIGKSNVKAVQRVLHKMNIPLLAQDVGGVVGRTMILDMQGLEVSIKYSSHPLNVKIKI